MLERLARRLGYEKRESAGFTDALVASILASADGAAALATSTAALETCASLVGRAFASAKVTGKRSEVVTPDLMMICGRALVRRGESLFLVRPGADGPQLVPVSTWSIEGTYDPSTWVYELTLPGPSVLTSVRADAADVCPVRTNIDSERPWRGTSPIDTAALEAGLAANAAKALSDEAKSPRGSFIPTPGGQSDALAADVRGAKGATLLVESMSANWGAGGPPPKDWDQRRFGFSAPAALLDARTQASDALMAACGISAAIFRARDAASAVASYRHFVHALVGPLGRLLAMELRAKLDAPDLSVDFADLRAGDVQARANAFRKLVEAGIPIERALGLSGLLAVGD